MLPESLINAVNKISKYINDKNMTHEMVRIRTDNKTTEALPPFTESSKISKSVIIIKFAPYFS